MKQVQFQSQESPSQATNQLNSYVKNRLLPILQPLQHDILKHRPYDIKSFSYLWLQNYKQTHADDFEDSASDNEQQSEQVFKAKVARFKKRKGFRTGVSGQSGSSMQSQLKDIQTNTNMTFQRTDQAKIKILIELRNSILFKNMCHSSLLRILDRMKPIKCKVGDIIIKEGDDGNQLFIVDQGLLKCVVSSGKQPIFYGPGQIFGELALLYNTKRGSTIIAQQDSLLYSLGRLQFNTILRNNVMKKTEICDRVLSNIDIFQSLDQYEKSKLYEALREIEVASGDYVIREGQIGDCFYIVSEGKLVAQKKNIETGELSPVYYYKERDYFGELAIMKNMSRQASVKALTKCKLLFIERSSFKRLLGSIQAILRRNQSRYKGTPTSKKIKKKKVSVDSYVSK